MLAFVAMTFVVVFGLPFLVPDQVDQGFHHDVRLLERDFSFVHGQAKTTFDSLEILCLGQSQWKQANGKTHDGCPDTIRVSSGQFMLDHFKTPNPQTQGGEYGHGHDVTCRNSLPRC